MDAEKRLISKVVLEGDLQPLLQRKITKDFFFDEENREVYLWLMEYWRDNGKVPGAKMLRNNFPTYGLIKGSEPLGAYLTEVVKRRKFALLFTTLQEASDRIEEDDVEATANVLAAGLLKVHTEVTELRDTNIIETWADRLERYEYWRENAGKLHGIPSGFPTIDEALRGFQPEQLVTFIGEPKVGKSTMLIRMAIEAHNYGRTPLFIGFEMSNEEQEARHDSMVSGISYTRLLAGRLDDEETATLAKSLKRMKSSHPFILSSDPSGTTVSGIAAKIEQYRPDIVFIDGVYMMDDEEGEPRGSAQAITNITRALKRLAQRTETPLIISTQVLTWKYSRKRGLDGNAIGYSSSFIQDSDVVLGVEHHGDESDPIKKVSIVMARSAPKRHTLISWDWEHGLFTELSEEAADEGYGVEDELEDEDDVGDTDYAPDEDPKAKPRKVKRKGSG